MKNFIGIKVGNVTIEKPLQKGGYGYSFLGYDESLEKDRVVKISKYPIHSPEAEKHEMQDFINEGLILSRLNHGQIVSIIEHGEIFEHRYMILNFIEGPTILKLLTKFNQIKQEQACKWEQLIDPLTALALTISCLEPLAYAHQTRIQLPSEGVKDGIAHRDISTGNLILGTGTEYEGKIHLIDFGAAKTGVNVSATINTKIVGSPQYLSPMRLLKPQSELEKKKLFWKSFRQTQHDVHAMGCIFYELLTGKSFIPGYGDVPTCLAAIVNPKTYEGLYQKIKIYDKSIQDIIKKSIVMPDIEKNKTGNQYKSATEMKEDYEKVFYRLSGFAHIENVLTEFSRKIENIDKLAPVPLNMPTMVEKHTRTGRVKTGKRTSAQTSLKWVYFLMVIMLGVTLYLSFDLLKEKKQNTEAAKTNKRVGEPASTQPLTKKSPQISKPKKVAVKKIKQAPKKPAKRVTPKKVVETASLKGAETLQKNRPINKDTLTKSKAAPIISPELIAKRQMVLFEQINRHLKAKNYKRANLINNSLLKETNDPALYLIKAEIIRGRMGENTNVSKIIAKAKGKPSKFLSENQMWVKHQILSH